MRRIIRYAPHPRLHRLLLLALARGGAVAAWHGLAILLALALTCLLHCLLHALALLLIGPGLCLGILHLWWRLLSIAPALAGLRARRVLVVTGLGLPLLARLRLALARILLALLRLLALRILLPWPFCGGFCCPFCGGFC